MLDPPLETYVNGKIALLGDAVCIMVVPLHFFATIRLTGARHASSSRSWCWTSHRRRLCPIQPTLPPTNCEIQYRSNVPYFHID